MLQKGDVVVATAGKEKNKLYVVVEIDEKFAFIADGKRLKVSKPKKKSLKHVQKASKIGLNALALNSEQNNVAIRKFLKERSEYVEGRRD